MLKQISWVDRIKLLIGTFLLCGVLISPAILNNTLDQRFRDSAVKSDKRVCEAQSENRETIRLMIRTSAEESAVLKEVIEAQVVEPDSYTGRYIQEVIIRNAALRNMADDLKDLNCDKL